ncbi:UDP-galactose transporter [Coccidioides immitis RS]|uniref:UDP-galactose transporter n=2 Tax=Coccidioides immitis TaxID=5501 RepID=J3KJP7_COCIM|nr:UDP-galactose transporter [Coccidioides immitis RS]EAS36323.3 UDP-galactose transporter [Coccidioides immitis RS]KMP01671.1 UDP-galactose transporter [Coccidioides immitis RMSCC 2394]
MGRDVQKQSSWMGVRGRYVFLVLLTIQCSSSILLLHYSRVMPVVGDQRYITSTAVFLNEVIKLAICLTIALYEVSKSAPPSMPATSLFGSLAAAIFTGDSWKLAVPAALYTISNSLQYIALSNVEAVQFQVTYQLKLIATAVFGAMVMRKSLPYAKWMILLLLVAGVALVQIPPVDPHELDRRTHVYLPRRLSDLQQFGVAAGPVLRKRSATYEGIQDDMIQGHPVFNARTGLLTTLGACFASGLAGLSFEKVLRDSTQSTSVWIRNVQLAIYSIFPALFIGVIFLDGERVAKRGFFHGYNWTVWSVIAAQAVGGIAASFCISYSELGLLQAASAMSIVLSSLASPFFFDIQVSAYFILGTLIVLVACFVYIPSPLNAKSDLRPRLPPIRIEKAKSSPDTDGSGQELAVPPNDFSIKLPTTPLISEASALTTSRPGSPSPARHHARAHSSRGYFGRQHHEN